MCSTGRPVDEISVFLLFTVTDGGDFGFYAPENSARLFKRGVKAYFFYKYLKLPKTTVKRYLQKSGHGIMVLDPTIHKCQPVYLHHLLKPLNRTHNLRSPDHDQLVVPRVSSKMGEGLCRLRPASSRIVSLMRLKNLNLHSHFAKK